MAVGYFEFGFCQVSAFDDARVIFCIGGRQGHSKGGKIRLGLGLASR